MLIAVASGAAGVLFGLHRVYQSDLPDPESLQTIRPALRTPVYSADGEVLYTFFQENRVLIPLSEMPSHLVGAVLAVEDRKFREHWGVDLMGIARAFWSNIRHRRLAQGGSTITQQLARDLFLTKEKTVSRKLKELLLAIRIEQTYSKDEILELYLNQIYFGEGAYGVEAASRAFFDKHARDLTLPESALLAGLPRNPSGYSPRDHPKAAKMRQGIVLDAMLEVGAVSPKEYREAQEAPIQLSEIRPYGRVAPYFVSHVKRQLEETYGAERLYRDGMKVYTTLDTRLQAAAEEALESWLSELEIREEYPVQRDSTWLALKPKPEGQVEYIQGALVALDPAEGGIRAMVGGRSFEESYFNCAVQAKRQPGSAFKVFVYTEAIRQGFTAGSVLLDAPLVIPGPAGDDWEPPNYSKTFRGLVTLRLALEKSINIPAVKLLLGVGARNVVRTAHSMGIEGRLSAYPSLALGSAEVTLLELTSAYGVLANQGIRSEPISILEVQDRYGLVLERNQSKKTDVLDAQTSYIVTNMLASAINHGTGIGARSRGFRLPAAGKTGTTNDYRDAWFMGYTPDLVTGVWVGFLDNRSMGDDMTGAAAALPIWTRFMIEATKNSPGDDFPAPEGIVTRQICTSTGYLAGPRCPESREEIFISGTEPTGFCTLHAPIIRQLTSLEEL
jgi:penicillin-binding protein 1A